jgi:predicted DNA-binding protein (MmcQ/YjbR family)
MGRKDLAGDALERLREFGLRYPGAHTKSPWPGHMDLAVNDKTFAYMSVAGEPLSISCKLPRSAEAALSLPFTTPTAYGLGKSGWVTSLFPDGVPVPVELLEQWIDESYRAQAPKRLSAGVPPLAAVEVSASAANASRGSGRAKPARAKPAAKPARAKPAATKPVRAEPAATRPARAKPAATKPAATKPSRGSASAGAKAPARPRSALDAGPVSKAKASTRARSRTAVAGRAAK